MYFRCLRRTGPIMGHIRRIVEHVPEVGFIAGGGKSDVIGHTLCCLFGTRANLWHVSNEAARRLVLQSPAVPLGPACGCSSRSRAEPLARCVVTRSGTVAPGCIRSSVEFPARLPGRTLPPR